MGGYREGTRVSKQYWCGTSEKSQGYQASIQCWAIIGLPRKAMVFHCRADDGPRLLRNAMVFHCRADDGPLIMVCWFFLTSHQLKKKIK